MFILFLTSLVTLLASFYTYRRFWCHRYFKRLGIPDGPAPHFFFGNLLDLWRDDRHKVMHKWSQLYGPIYGIYEGPDPVLVVSSIEAVEQICVTQASSFSGHMFLNIQPDPDRNPNDPLANMFMGRKDHWRRPRLAASPFFSTQNMRSTKTCLAKNCNFFLQAMPQISDNNEGAVVNDLVQLCQRLAIQFVAEVGYSTDLQLLPARESEGEAVLKGLQGVFAVVANRPPWLFKLMTALPTLANFVEVLARFAIRFYPSSSNNKKPGPSKAKSRDGGYFSPINVLLDFMAEIIDKRRRSVVVGNEVKPQRRDLVQMLSDCAVINWETQEKKPFLHDEQLRMNLMGLMMAGYETTSTTMAIVFHLLSVHPEAQEKLFQEIRGMVEDQQLDVEEYAVLMSSKMPYLDAVFKEALRLYPPAINLIHRLAPFSEDPVYVCGLEIPKTLKSIQADMYSIHHDVNIWGPVAPDEFYPERFLSDYATQESRPAAAFLSFGLGPHQCLGVRLATYEVKFAVVQMLLRYELLPSGPETRKQLPVRVDHLMLWPTVDLSVRLKNRQPKFGVSLARGAGNEEINYQRQQ